MLPRKKFADYRAYVTEQLATLIDLWLNPSQQPPLPLSDYYALYRSGQIGTAHLAQAIATPTTLGSDAHNKDSPTIHGDLLYVYALLLDANSMASNSQTLLEQPVKSSIAFSITEARNHLADIALAELAQLNQAIGFQTTLDSFIPTLTHIPRLLIDPLIHSYHCKTSAWSTSTHVSETFYNYWRILIRRDASLLLQPLDDWQEILAELPDDPFVAIALQLHYFDIPQARWRDYLLRLLITHPTPIRQRTSDNLADHLAVRLISDRLWLQQVCHEQWRTEAKLSALLAYFHAHPFEFWVRRRLF